MSPTAKWVGAIVGLLGANVLGTLVLIAASHHGASRVIPNYYERGVHYDDQIDQAEADRRLGWHVDLAVAGGVATITARDVAGTPLAGATVRVDGSVRATGAAILCGGLFFLRGALP